MLALAGPCCVGGASLVAQEDEESAPDPIVFELPAYLGERLSGDWWGARTMLEEDYGLTFEFYYTVDVLATVSGGVRRRVTAPGEIDLLLTAELEPLIGWQGARVFLYGLGTHGDDPSDDVGDIQAVDNVEAFDTWKLYEAWLEQDFLDQRISVLAGLYDVNSEFDVIPGGAVFIHSSHGIGADFGLSGRNGPSIFPVTSLAVRLEARPTDSCFARIVVADGVPGDPDDPRGTQVILDRDDGLLIAGEVGCLNLPSEEVRGRMHHTEGELPTAEQLYGYYGKYAVGVWGYTGEFGDFENGVNENLRRRGSWGVYALSEQGVFFEEDDPAQGLSVFGRIGFADERVNAVDAYLGAGLNYRGAIPGRGRDQLGFAVAAAHLGDEFRDALRRASGGAEQWEVALELTYRARITEWLSVQPDVQLVINPGGEPDLDDAVIVGARVLMSF